MFNNRIVYNESMLLEAHAEFVKNGIVFFNKILPSEIFSEAELKINEKTKLNLKTKDLVNLHMSDKWFREFVMRPEFLRIARSLLGVPNVKIFSSMILNKPPLGMMSVPWHQDAAYDWPLDPVDCASLWLAFDDITIENGAMEVSAGAHNKGSFPMKSSAPLTEGDSYFSSELVRSIPDELLSEYPKIHLTMDKGCASFHHSMLPHRSNPNLTGLRRCAFIVRYCRGDAKLVIYPGMKRENDFKDFKFLECEEVL